MSATTRTTAPTTIPTTAVERKSAYAWATSATTAPTAQPTKAGARQAPRATTDPVAARRGASSSWSTMSTAPMGGTITPSRFSHTSK
ncbi:hypothetical protein BC477_05875 [Clavibacter michiganensis subsp. michiganensis]|uniref:Uncharacterized protein n=1 Tax=Clavibacter michiganensis subsp. michiganensis TaxID=33013 RepID=A0A251XM10_CLAMM|nr:hypothetical protein BC477_05875 [Clavibacter michiganensis subsp. michiganensis]OUE04243.1 hypothetical protein CMMCAS07_04805 [Clavibacter michiganensis subsp. michiganensis]